MKRRLARPLCPAVLIALFLCPPASGEQCESVMQLLEEGIVQQQSLNDLAAAESIFRSFASSDTICAAARERAGLLLGRCLRAQGKMAEAQRVLETAAAGKSEYAQMAQALLSGELEANDRMTAQVTGLLAKIREPGSGDEENKLYKMLLSLGDPAVPSMVAALEESNDHSFVATLAETLVLIGTRSVTEYVEKVARSKNRYLQHVFVTATTAPRKGSYSTTTVRPFQRIFVPLIPAVDEKTRLQVVRLVGNAITKGEILEWLVAFEEPALRVEILNQALVTDSPDDHEFMERLRPVLKRLFTASEPERAVVGSLLQHPGNLAVAPGRALFLDGIGRGVFRFQGSQRGGGRRAEAIIPAEELLPFAANFASLRDDARDELRQLVLLSHSHWDRASIPHAVELIRAGMSQRPDQLTEWIIREGPRDVPYALELIRSGFAVWELTPWVLERATDEHYVAIVEELGNFAAATPQVLDWLKGHHPDGAALPGLERWLGDASFRAVLRGGRWPSRTGGRRNRRTGSTSTRDDAMATLCSAVASLGTTRAQALLLKVAEDPLDYAVARAALLQKEATSADTLLALARTLPDGDGFQDGLVESLLRRGICDAETLLPILRREGSDLTALARPRREGSRCGAKESAEILQALLSGEDAARWWSVLCPQFGLFKFQDYHDATEVTFATVPDEVIQVVFSTALENPNRPLRSRVVRELLSIRSGPKSDDAVQLSDDDPPLYRDYGKLQHALMQRALENGTSDLVLLALEDGSLEARDLPLVRPYLGRQKSRLAVAAASWVGRIGTQEHVTWLVPSLKHSLDVVRAVAVDGLYRLGGDEQLGHILPLTHDPSPRVRATVYGLLGRSKAPEVGDVLVEGLRDEEHNVREIADAALKAIEQYHARRSQWEGRRESFSLKPESAAEALLRQATSGKSKLVRLTAIASLGALNLPETLPHLIELLEDDDPQVREAATATVERINASARAPEGDAPR